ncbi:MAG: adenosylmethionine--8-amino-7-oxononanoate transaminase [Myxococcota bacterium]
MNPPDSDPQTLAALDHRHLWHPFTQHREWFDAGDPLIVARGEGNALIDVHGRRYLDGVSSLWTTVHGHRHPDLDRALRDQLDQLAHSTLLGLTHPPAIRLAAALVAKAPPGLTRVFYSDDGSTAVEVALKMAFQLQQHRGHPRRTRFAALRDGYHGDTLGAVSVGSIDLFHAVYRPLLFDAVALPSPIEPGGDEELGCLHRALALLDQHADTLAAFVYEPLVQGAAGMKMHSASFVRALGEAARARGVLLVADEVAVGFGRTGTLFATEQVGLTPDFLCLAKGLAGGYLPLAATLTTEAVFEGFLGDPAAHRQLFHGHTFTGNPLGCAVALESLALFDRADVLGHVARLSAALGSSLADLAAVPWVGGVRQRGVMVGIDLRSRDGRPFDPAARTGHRVAMACRPRGAIVRPLGDTIVLNPPLSFGLDEAHALVEIVGGAIRDVLGG